MRSNIRFGSQFSLVLLGAGAALVSGLTMAPSAQAQSTPITDEYGVTGTSPDNAAWLEAINEQYGLPTETPITEAQGTDVAVWAEAIRGEYGVPSEEAAAVGTPVTDEYGAVGSSPDAAAWYEGMREAYGIGTGI